MIYRCEACGLPYRAKPSDRRRFCSHVCADLANRGPGNPNWQDSREIRTCLQCGKEFLEYRNYVKQGRGRFCSHSCRSTFWFRGRNKSPEHVEKMRLRQLGKRPSDETRQKIRAARARQVMPRQTAAARAKRSAALKDRPNPRNAARNKSLEMRAKVSAALRGRHKTVEHRAKISAHRQSIRRRISEWVRRAILDGRISPKNLSGRRYEYLDRLGRLWCFRSSWEISLAQRLDREQLSWSYEPCRLLLSTGYVYIPDFWVTEWQTYIEVKGWKQPTAMAKIEAARADGHPILVLDKRAYQYLSTEQDIVEFLAVLRVAG